MQSPTQRLLSADDVMAAARVSFGGNARVSDLEMFTGGSFGSVWRVDLADGRRTVLKAAPRPGARLLRYECGMLAAEADYLRIVASEAPGVPAPRLLHETDDWLFMTLLPGVPMHDLPAGVDTTGARRESGAAIARLHAVTGDFFGYPGDRPRAATWPAAFTAIVDAALDDAVDFDVTLPVPPAVLRRTVAAHTGTLATVTTPVLLHFDLWDGNVLVTVDDGPAAHLSGLVDGERYLYGDPLVDFASPALFRDMLDDPDEPFVRGYLAERPLTLGDDARRRLWLYQLYLYLLMIVEFPSRGMTPQTEPERWAFLGDLVTGLVARLDD